MLLTALSRACVLWLLLSPVQALCCSVLFYVDAETNRSYWANLEDYWYDTKAYVEIQPRTRKESARLWYGWDDFAQGGVNEHGLVFDGAVTPDQPRPEGTHKPRGNLGDEILARCKTVDEAIAFLEEKRVAVTNGHLLFADADQNAAIVEWVDGERKVIRRDSNYLLMTNYLLSEPHAGNYPCPRYQIVEKVIQEHQESGKPTDLLLVGNLLGRASQPPAPREGDRIGGTLYSTFLDLTDMKLFIVYQLDNASVMKFDLKAEFEKKKKQRIRMEKASSGSKR